MGMFDSIYFECPECGSEIEEQSKAGDCYLHRYTGDDVPLAIAADIQDNIVWCQNLECGRSWVIRAVTPIKSIEMKLVNTKMATSESEND